MAAVDVLSERGFEAATVEENTRVAGVAKGSFYREFSSKEELAVALQERFFDEVVARASAIASRLGAEDIWALADEFIEMIVDLHLENRDIAAVLMKEASVKGHEDFANADKRMKDIVTMGLRVGVATGEFDCKDPETVASILIHGIEGVLHHAMLYDEQVHRDRVLAAAKHVMRRSLGAKG
jgi:TetR/AcrR family transcriptional repressor of nem operon